jgi:hypothetical protein
MVSVPCPSLRAEEAPAESPTTMVSDSCLRPAKEVLAESPSYSSLIQTKAAATATGESRFFSPSYNGEQRREMRALLFRFLTDGADATPPRSSEDSDISDSSDASTTASDLGDEEFSDKDFSDEEFEEEDVKADRSL